MPPATSPAIVEPVSLALKEVTETRRLLELLITSSESFDYATAKLALAQLQQKTRHLASLEGRLRQYLPLAPNVQEVVFTGTAAGPESRPPRDY
jgi:hypothetical protein